ncbi:MAG TPA: hypothetical protein VIH54_09985 [Chthoniobacterales bacterium]|jgi:hypothetical protein
MEVLDSTIANVALRYIAGGLSAAVTDSEWVITSYLAALFYDSCDHRRKRLPHRGGIRLAIKAIQIQTFGKPTDVARCVDIADVGAPEANEVVVALQASPINQYDLLMIAGG